MIKKILPFLSAIIIVFLISYLGHSKSLDLFNSQLSYSLLKVYLFHLIASAIVFTLVVLVFFKIPNQAGYAYLASVFLKLGFFVLIFKASVFTEVDLTKVERVSLVIPLFIFLISEAIGVSKLLNSN
ncbi:hypothetical protein LPB136_11595 [Tenacibaculum todarodis]|uniref:Uncharacterized protein n=1 Tax=Tenacibaculum todarodis TaxID=1850252 RepID=A0A1L3JLC8_9FLAO|nr:DUF6168 family protein [Tenacibaculum todarodis]APG65966.1 hypothetical protein LPB136_11595 [Tenacibaculum todarodis]